MILAAILINSYVCILSLLLFHYFFLGQSSRNSSIMLGVCPEKEGGSRQPANAELRLTMCLLQNGSGYPTTQLKNTVRFALFVALWNLFIGGAYLAFNFILTSSIIASVASNAAFFAVTWLLWLAT